MTRIETIGLLGCAFCASAGAQVTCWDGDCGNASISVGVITITGPGEFWFESIDGTGLGDITRIEVAQNVTGLIEVHIESSLGGAPAAGAANIGEIRLDPQGATWTGNVVELYITGELGVNGPTLVRNMSGVVAFGTSDEDITIGASLSADITASAITGDIDVGLFFLSNGSITVSTLGNVTVDKDLAGDITINGNYGGTITAGDVVGADALIQTVDGDFSGTMSVASTSFGQVNIDGNMSGTIAFDGGWPRQPHP